MIDIDSIGNPLISIYQSQLLTFLDEIIKGEDKTSYIRAFEFLIKIIIKSEKYVTIFKGSLIKALNEYSTSDLLTKLNIMEIVPELATCTWSSGLLAESNFISTLLTPNSEVYILLF